MKNVLLYLIIVLTEGNVKEIIEMKRKIIVMMIVATIAFLFITNVNKTSYNISNKDGSEINEIDWQDSSGLKTVNYKQI